MFIIVFLVLLLGAMQSVRFQWLTANGAIQAVIIGICIYIGLGYKGVVLISVFFATSSLLGKLKKQKKHPPRDGKQVWINGGIPAFTSLLFFFTNDALWLQLFCLSLGVAISDTWSSEIGKAFGKKSYSIVGFREMQQGESGGISTIGTLSGVVGAGLFALLCHLLFQNVSFAIIFLFSVLGNIIDSLLGQFLQAKYVCKQCNRIIEKKNNHEHELQKYTGFSWMTNNVVNLISIIGACLLYVSVNLFMA